MSYRLPWTWQLPKAAGNPTDGYWGSVKIKFSGVLKKKKKRTLVFPWSDPKWFHLYPNGRRKNSWEKVEHSRLLSYYLASTWCPATSRLLVKARWHTVNKAELAANGYHNHYFLKHRIPFFHHLLFHNCVISISFCQVSEKHSIKLRKVLISE